MARSRAVEDVKTVEHFPYPAIDFKFVNRGQGTAFLWQFELEIIRAEVDVTPALSFSYDLGKNGVEPNYTNSTITLVGKNDGWGDATNLSLYLSNSLLGRLFPEQRLQLGGEVNSGQDAVLGSLDIQEVGFDAIKDLRELIAERRLLIERVVKAMKTSDPSIMEEKSQATLLSDQEMRHIQRFFFLLTSGSLASRIAVSNGI